MHYLVELAKYKSISITAEKIFVSQPTISKALKALEEELGVVLFNRHHQGVILTEQGEKISKIAADALSHIERIKTVTTLNVNPELTGNLTIYTLPIISNSILLNVLTAFCNKFPNVKVNIKSKEITKIFANISENTGDLGIVSSFTELYDKEILDNLTDSIVHEHLITGNLYAITSKRFPLITQESISMKELMNYPLCVNDMHNWQAAFSFPGTPNIFLRTNDFYLASRIISEGLAVGFYFDFLLNRTDSYNTESLSYIPIKENIGYSLAFIRPKDSPFTDAAKEFINILKMCLFDKKHELTNITSTG